MASEAAGGPSVVITAQDTDRGLRVHADDTASLYGWGPTLVTLITTKSVEVTDSGTIFYLNLAGGFTVTLPTLAQVLAMEGGGGGFWCKFIVKTQPTTAYIITEDGGADTNTCIGGINELEVDTNSDGPSSTGYTFTNFVATTADVGDYVEVMSDGVNWYIHGQTAADGGITLT